MDNEISTKKRKRMEKQNRRKHPIISKEIILIWEELRQKNIKNDRKYELCDKIIKLSKSVIGELIQQKSTARVFESVIEYGVDEHRWTIFEIIKKDILSLCTGPYSYFVVKFMLKYGTKDQRLAVFDLMTGHIVDLIQHAHASKVVEAAYNEFANSKQRNQMIQEFYGKTFALFNDGKEIKHLSDFTSQSNFDMTILNNIHKVVLPIIRKQQIDLTIVQHILKEYVEVLIKPMKENPELAKPYESLLDEIIELIGEHLLKLCNTREGTKVAMMLFNECSIKLRKKVIQALKEVIVETCQHTDAYLFALTVLDQTDDTKLLNKCVTKPILENLDVISNSVNGRKIISFIVNHRDKRFFDKYILDLLKQGDGNRVSKKDADIRSKEILEFASKPLLQWLDTHICDCLHYKSKIILVHYIMIKCLSHDEEMKTIYHNIMNSIVMYANEPMYTVEPVSKRKSNIKTKAVVKKKIKMFTGEFQNADNEMEVDEVKQETDMVIEGHLFDSFTGCEIGKSLCNLEKEGKIEGFSNLCIEKFSQENLRTFIDGNRSAFVLVSLFDIGKESVQTFLKELFQLSKNRMSQSDLAGVKVLYTRLFCE